MNVGHSYVPPELLVEITQRLPVADLKRLRSVCKGIAIVTSQFLFRTVHISTQLQDRQNLTSISNHQVLSQYVREIIYDSTYRYPVDPIEGVRLNKTNYRTLLLETPFDRGTTFTKAAIDRGFKHFQARLKEQTDLLKYHGANLTRPGDLTTLPANFVSLLDNPEMRAEVLPFLPDDLIRLVEGLPKMPNVRRFVISDTRHTRNINHKESCFGEGGLEGIREVSLFVHNEGTRGSDAVVLDPRPWPDFAEDVVPDHDRSWYRGFSVLMQAASMANITKVESFEVDCISDYSGLSHSILDMSPSELRHTTNAFRNLRTVILRLDSSFIFDCQSSRRGRNTWSRTLESGSIAIVLSAATHLEILGLEFNEIPAFEPTEVPSFVKLIGIGTWPCLRSVSLGCMTLHPKEFLDFFGRHRQTLRSLRLEQVSLFSKHYASQKEGHKVFRPWHDTFQAMAKEYLALTRFDTHSHTWDPLSYALGDCVQYHVHGSAEIFRFLESGGKRQKQHICRHCDLHP